MDRRVTIYGKARWPFTAKAREAYASKGYRVEYRDVKADSEALEEMLGQTGGQRRIPVIVEGDRVEVGFGGGW